MKDLALRTKQIAEFLVEKKATIRAVAKAYNLSKSTVHFDLKNRLPKLDLCLYSRVRTILNWNFNEKNIRGGISTQKLYKKIKKS